jgi:tetrahydromethanopterin S-methyltransferase subunit E
VKKLLLLALFSAPALSAIQCGGYKLTINDSEGLVRINGELVTVKRLNIWERKVTNQMPNGYGPYAFP